MPELFKEIFHDLGTSLESEQVELRKCEPNYVIWFADNDTFEMTTDLSRMKSQINKLEGKDSFHQFHSFMQESGTHYELSLSHVLKRNFPRLFSMLRPPLVESLLAMHPFECVYTRVAKYFKSDKLQRVFTFGTMYLGMSPFQAPATYSLLQYTEIADGIWYPKGGFQIVRVLDLFLAPR
jgi:phytoene desaturase (3,4-didehydrolycopene-forming)